MNSTPEEAPKQSSEKKPAENILNFHRIQFRAADQVYTANSRLNNLRKGEVVMVQTDHGPEPAVVRFSAATWLDDPGLKPSDHNIVRRGTRDEVAKYDKLGEMEQKAFGICSDQIERLELPMRLVKVERFFSGSKIIFYFTAENRVDFRELVKCLVQEFRTRVEMRQIGVRHETKMIGGLGCCGRELCCSSFIKKFESVSIKMAKAQNLPLNPVKISGACNRLLCCLNYEYKTYKAIRKNMPKIGRRITLKDGGQFKVCRHNVLQETITVVGRDGEESILDKEKWQAARTNPPPKQPSGKK